MTTEPAPLPQPIRVLTKGASIGVTTSWMGGPRSDYTYPRVIEAELLTAGVPAAVVNQTVAAERLSHAIKNWQRDIMPWSPDVAILYYGHMETVHKVLPAWFERHAHSLKGRSGPARAAYRTYGIRPVYKVAAGLQAQLDRRLPATGKPFYNPDRVAEDLAILVRRVRWTGSPLVLLPDVLPPSKRYTDWFPGMAERLEVWNRTLHALVARLDHPDVRVFRVAEPIADLLEAGVDPTPDGVHYTPEVHLRIGRAMAREILAWRETQPHLLDWRAHPLREPEA